MRASVVLCLFVCGCGTSVSTPEPAPAPVVEPAPAPPPAPESVDVGIGVALHGILLDGARGADFVASVAPSVSTLYVSQCGEDPRTEERKLLATDAEKQEWHAARAATWSPKCAENPRPAECKWSGALSFRPEKTVCDARCCELNDIGHSAPYLRRFCSENGKVTELTVEDGC